MQRRTFLAASAATLGLAEAFRRTAAAVAGPLTVQAEHPRLLLTGFDPTRSLIDSDPAAADWYAKTKAAADDLLTRPVSEYVIPDGKRLLATSRETVHRVYTLSLAYAVERDVRYRDRLWDELAAVCDFPDWNHQRHFLDVGEMTHAVAIGYDWWYDEWTEGQRATMETAVLQYGLQKGLDVYAGKPTPLKFHEVVNNWNIVCNGGLIVGALAVADRYPEVAQQILDNALASLPIAVEQYAPDGGYPEGGGYWEYATKYLVLLMAALETATGAEDISAEPGLDNTVDFPLQLTGPTGATFNYYDSGSGAPQPPEVFWMARRYQRPDYGWWAKQGADLRQPGWSQLPLGLLWYDPGATTGPIEAGTSPEAYFRRCEVAMMRSGWEREDALYLAGKAGDNTTNHGDLDIGTFILEALGQRWFTELGSDDYNLDAYFGTLRWTYYRKRAEGQNTLVLNPGMDPDQDASAAGSIVDRGTGPAGAWMIADGTATHPSLTSWQRGWRLFDHRRQVVIQDELSTSEPSELWWFAHTAAGIEIGDDGRSATLSLSGKELLARIAGPESAQFVVMDAHPLWTSPDPEGQNANAGLRKLAIRMRDVTDIRLSVQLTPLYPGVKTPPVEKIKALSSWSAGPKTVATLDDLALDGETIDGFATTNFSYGVDLSAEPRVTATPTDRHSRVKIKPGAADRAAMITVTQRGKATGIYRLWPETPLGLGNFPRTVLTSSDDGNVGENTMDDDPETRWSAQGDGEWIAYDMGSDGPVASVQIAWYSGDQRSTVFDIEVAAAGATTWTTVFSGSSSGTTTEPETYAFDVVTAQYLRIVGHGNTANDWNSIAEVVIDGRTVQIDRPNVLESLTIAAPVVPLSGQVSATLTGTMTDGSAADLDGLDVGYLTLDPEVATVSDAGQIAGVAEGKVFVAAIVETPERRLLHTRTEVTVVHPDRPRFEAIADTYVRDGAYADDNFGDDSAALVKQAPDPDSGYNRTALLAFEPQAQTRPVTQVLLNLYAEVADDNGDEIDLVVRPAGEFDEASVTWNNQPETDAAIGSTHATSEPSWCQVDITDAVADRVAQGEPIALAIVQDEPDSDGLATRISSRESGSVSYLQVVLGPA